MAAVARSSEKLHVSPDRRKESLEQRNIIGTGLPVERDPQFEQIGVESVNVRTIIRRRELQHVGPVCHDFITGVGIPIET
jgi:hypothetical protein